MRKYRFKGLNLVNRRFVYQVFTKSKRSPYFDLPSHVKCLYCNLFKKAKDTWRPPFKRSRPIKLIFSSFAKHAPFLQMAALEMKLPSVLHAIHGEVHHAYSTRKPIINLCDCVIYPMLPSLIRFSLNYLSNNQTYKQKTKSLNLILESREFPYKSRITTRADNRKKSAA